MSTWQIAAPNGALMDFSLYGAAVDVRAMVGTGMAPVQIVSTPYGRRPGAIFQTTKVEPRVFSLRLTLAPACRTAERLHALRRQLIAVIRPDVVYPQQPCLLRYTGAGANRWMYGYYQSGLEINAWEDFTETVDLAFFCPDPFFFGTDADETLNNLTTLSASHAVQRTSGVWTNLAIDNYIETLFVGGSDLFAFGYFSSIGGVAADYCARYDGTAWYAIGTPPAPLRNGAQAPDGRIYAINANTLTTIYRYDGSWSSFATVTGGVVVALVFDSDGSLYAGGSFTAISGTAANRIAKWNGSAWSALGTGVTRASLPSVNDMAVTPDGTLYVCGIFDNAGGVTVNNVARWNGSAWEAAGATDSPSLLTAPWCIVVAPNGLIYMAGQFTAVGGVAAQYVAVYNGVVWQAVGDGLPTGVPRRSLAFDTSGRLVAMQPAFDTMGVMVWNGAKWEQIEGSRPLGAPTYAIAYYGNQLFVGYWLADDSTVPEPTTVTNDGSAAAAPIITIDRPGALTLIGNATTGQVMQFSDLTIADGETVTIDCSLGTITSDTRGDLSPKLLAGTILSGFVLIPGDNVIVIGSTGATGTATISWTNRYWSLD